MAADSPRLDTPALGGVAMPGKGAATSSARDVLSAGHGHGDGRAKSPLDGASWLSVLFFSWMTPLLSLGARQPLEEEDLPGVPRGQTVREVLDAFGPAWRRTLEEDRAAGRGSWRTLARAMLRAYGRRFYLGGAIHLVASLMQVLQPILVKELLRFLDDEDADEWVGWAYAVGLSAMAFAVSLAINNMFYHLAVFGARARVTLMAAVFDKSTRLSATARQGTSSGTTVNLMAADAERVFQAANLVNFVWVAPCSITLVLVLLVVEVGVAALAGVALMFALVPMQGVIGRAIGNRRRRMVVETDERVRTTSEVLAGIRLVKLYAWEDPFTARVNEVRDREVRHVRAMLYFKSFNLSMSFVWSVVASLAVFATYSLEGNTLDTPTVFAVIALMNAMRFPIALLPMALTMAVEGRVSLRRLYDFLVLEELPSRGLDGGARLAGDAEQKPDASEAAALEAVAVAVAAPDAAGGAGDAAAADSNDDAPAVSVRGGTFAWDASAEARVLRDVTLEVPRGALVAVIGTVGAGKSSLVSAVLGEMHREAGEVRVRGSVAYTAQQPWMRSATLRNNVLLGQPFDAARYREAVEAAALPPDIEMLPGGDETEIGERGINLSGGQKARVSLARAVYRRADVYILDDPLSAVDVHVGRHIFERCIETALAGRTRLVVLNSHLHFLPRFDSVVVVEDGRVAAHGTYEELRARYGELMRGSEQDEEEEEAEDAQSDAGSEAGGARRPRKSSSVGGASRGDLREASRSKAGDAAAASAPANGKDLVVEEARAVGAVSGHVLARWMAAARSGSARAGYLVFAGVMLVFGATQALRVMTDYWLAEWSRDDALGTRTQREWIGTYALLVLATVVLAVVRTALFTRQAWRSSHALHREVFQRLMRAPVNLFYDTVPLGRLTNLLSADLDRADSQLPDFMMQLMQNSLFLLAALVVCAVTSPWFLLLLLPGGVMFGTAQQLFRRSSRELKRIDNRSRSPVLSLFGETLSGIATIRAYRMLGDFTRLSRRLIDGNARAHWAHWMSNRWLAIRLDLASMSVILAVTLLSVGLKDSIRPELAALSIVYALQFMGLLQWTVRLTVQTEDSLTSTERLVQYTEVVQEAEYGDSGLQGERGTGTGTGSGGGWRPATGSIELRNLKLRYRPGLPLVLRGVSLAVRSGEKVGVVGRTGAGKSSLMLALFRMVEAEAPGSVLIDGTETSSLGLRELRQAMAVIPQDPVLFSGTLRYNLDPFGERTEAELWAAAERVHLAGVAREAGGLDAPVAEYGENFSHGQRQLICIARAMLRPTRVVVMDEATAFIDGATDATIQQTIREVFADRTVLTIAHRLDTIIYSDRVLVLDAGRAAEFASPLELIDGGGIFSSMVARTGAATAALLRRAAAGEVSPEELLAEHVDAKAE